MLIIIESTGIFITTTRALLSEASGQSPYTLGYGYFRIYIRRFQDSTILEKWSHFPLNCVLGCIPQWPRWQILYFMPYCYALCTRRQHWLMLGPKPCSAEASSSHLVNHNWLTSSGLWMRPALLCTHPDCWLKRLLQTWPENIYTTNIMQIEQVMCMGICVCMTMKKELWIWKRTRGYRGGFGGEKGREIHVIMFSKIR